MRGFAPSRRAVRTVLLTLWQIVTTASHTFVWNSVLEGRIDVRPLSRAMRLIAIGGQVLIAGFLLSLLFNEALRVNGPLELLVLEADETRSLLVPSVAIPLTMAALALGWGYVLAGALRVRWWLRAVIGALYLGFAALPLAPMQLGGLAFGVVPWWSALSLLLIGLALLVLPLVPARPVGEWCLMAWLNGCYFCGSVAHMAYIQVLSGGEFRVSSLASGLALSGLLLIAPFLYLAGLGWVDFALDLAGWSARAVRRHAPAWLGATLLLAFLAYRIVADGGALLGAARGADSRLALAGAALFCGGLALVGAWRRRQGPGAPVPRALIVGLLLLPILLQGLVYFGLSLAVFGPLLDSLAPAAHRRLDQAVAAAQRTSELLVQLRPLLIAGACLGVAAVAARRGHASAAAYALILAWHQALAWLTAAGRPLQGLRYAYAEVDRLVTLGLAGLALYWLARRQLSAERAVRLLGLAMLMALVNQTDFLDNPFSPLFGFAGVFFLVFGIVWNILGAGGFANQETPGMPRASRLMLYLGYVLISVGVAHWYLVSHNLVQQAAQAAFTTNGFLIFGLPLAYLALVERGAPLLAEADEPAGPPTDAPAPPGGAQPGSP